ncbi:MAG: hypothetical protein ACRDPR_15090 [Nocardioidaceae bacterium]
MNASFDRLPAHGDSIGLLVAIGGRLPRVIGKRLQPGDLGPADHLGGAGPRTVVAYVTSSGDFV